MFSLNVLLYGDHADLAGRCLGSLLAALDPARVADVRVGQNAVSAATAIRARDFAAACAARGVPATLYAEEGGRNVLKYPLMRRMFYDPARPAAAGRVVWFDDDSFVRPEAAAGWWASLDAAWADAARPAVMGALYRPTYAWTPAERAAIVSQRWFGGVTLDEKPVFATGGFWAADYAFLAKWDYPDRALRHNGGDVLLGEICRQQRRKVAEFRRGVAINADAAGRESKAPRRGATTPRPFQVPADHSHHDFAVVTEGYPCAST